MKPDDSESEKQMKFNHINTYCFRYSHTSRDMGHYRNDLQIY